MTSIGIPESEANGAVAMGYASIRQVLDVPNVPIVYRRMALEESVFIPAVDLLPRIVDLADAIGFRDRAQKTARQQLPRALHAPPPSDRYALPPDGQSMLRRFAGTNPIGLLFTMALAGIERDPVAGVMSPPLPRRDANLEIDIAACHGSDFVPSMWKDLREWTEVYEGGWWGLRRLASAGALSEASSAVMSLAKESLLGTTIEHDSAALAALMSKSLADTLSWFPTGIATLIVEVEWLRVEFADGS